MPSRQSDNFCAYEIESVADLLEILDPRQEHLANILETDAGARLGASDNGVPRPFSYGLWFRGEQNISTPVIPSAYKLFDSDGVESYDEKNAFFDLKLRMANLNTAQLNSFELLCIMRHYGFPARLLDWSESPLTALYFAVSTPDDRPLDDTDSVLTCLNAYRLNLTSCITENRNPGMFYPDSANVLIRSLMAEHTKLIDVLDRMDRVLLANEGRYNKRVMKLKKELNAIEETLERAEGASKSLSDAQFEVLRKLRYPVAVAPKRNNLRMAAQLANFTVHGGKKLPPHIARDCDALLATGDAKKMDSQTRIFSPVSLDELNNDIQDHKFLIHIAIKKDARSRIKQQLDCLSINNAALYPELDYQSKFVTSRWTKKKARPS